MNATDTKLLLKIQDEVDVRWVHFCYVETEVYKKFIDIVGSEEKLNTLLSIWCKSDFQVDMSMVTSEDLQTLRDLIKDRYKTIYPELYRDSSTDRQGWTRVWVTEKMRKVVQEFGEQSE